MRMYQKPSIVDRLGDLIGLVTEGVELALAKQVSDMAKLDPDLARNLRRRRGPGFRVVPKYDKNLVNAKLDFMDGAFAEGAAAFSKVVASCRDMIRAIDMADLGGAAAVIDCAALASHRRAIHSQVLLFHLRAAQVLCAIQEIDDAIVLHHECEPDPCAALPPATEEQPEPGAYEEDEAAEMDTQAAAEREPPTQPTEARRRGRGTAR
jgi:hypothetical protein